MPTKEVYINSVKVQTPIYGYKIEPASAPLMSTAEINLGNNNGCFTRSFPDANIRLAEITVYFNTKQVFGGYIRCNVSINEENWMEMLEKVSCCIDTNQKRPSSKDKNKDVKQMGQWIGHQKQNYKKNEEFLKIKSFSNYGENF